MREGIGIIDGASTRKFLKLQVFSYRKGTSVDVLRVFI